MKTVLKIAGMSCKHCAARVQKALEETEGVTKAEVSLDQGEAVVEGNDLSSAALAKAVTNAGYAVTSIE